MSSAAAKVVALSVIGGILIGAGLVARYYLRKKHTPLISGFVYRINVGQHKIYRLNHTPVDDVRVHAKADQMLDAVPPPINNGDLLIVANHDKDDHIIRVHIASGASIVISVGVSYVGDDDFSVVSANLPNEIRAIVGRYGNLISDEDFVHITTAIEKAVK